MHYATMFCPKEFQGVSVSDLLLDSGKKMESRLLAGVEFTPTFPEISVSLSDPSKLWKVSSALQKSIRRGYQDLAVRYAQAIVHGGKEDYLWRRLPIIALEDIGIVNLKLCAQVMALCRHKSYRTALGGSVQVASWIARELSHSWKSRTLTDVTCSWMVGHGLGYQFNDQKEEERLALSASTVSYGLGYALDGQSSSLTKEERLMALTAYMNVLVDAGASPLAAYLLYAGTKKDVSYLTSPLIGLTGCQSGFMDWRVDAPLVVPERGLQMVGGVPEWAFDQYVSDGKRAIAYVLKSSKSLKECLEKIGYQGDRQAMISMMLFQTESAVLDKPVHWALTSTIQGFNDQMEATSVGLNEEHAQAVRETLLSPVFQHDLRAARLRIVEGIPTHYPVQETPHTSSVGGTICTP